MLIVLQAILYLAVLCCVLGSAGRLLVYLRSADRLRMPVTPAPTTRLAVLGRLLAETFLFTSLFRADRLAWVLGWTFHVTLLWVLIEHLAFVFGWWPVPVRWLVSLGTPLPWLLLGALLGLWLRRLLVERVRHVSTATNHLQLAVLAALVVSGMLVRDWGLAHRWPARQFLQTLTELRWFDVSSRPSSAEVRGYTVFVLHLLFAALLIAIYPFSKLFHGIALWMMPTRNQRDAP
ncbi:MAG: respiratory nitrate reductase subunit gamma [Gammaproteobacteria bacterium]|nr:respiratory nitrate reductase subunit gamma [Gammaproteobacteria bacterium]